MSVFYTLGQPRPPRFVSDSIGYRPHAYNVTWTTDSFTPITEYKLLYRRSDVSWFFKMMTIMMMIIIGYNMVLNLST